MKISDAYIIFIYVNFVVNSLQINNTYDKFILDSKYPIAKNDSRKSVTQNHYSILRMSSPQENLTPVINENYKKDRNFPFLYNNFKLRKLHSIYKGHNKNINIRKKRENNPPEVKHTGLLDEIKGRNYGDPDSLGLIQRLSQSHFEFSLDLYTALKKGVSDRQNIIVSPLLLTSLLMPILLASEVVLDQSEVEGQQKCPSTSWASPSLYKNDNETQDVMTSSHHRRLVSCHIRKILHLHNMTRKELELASSTVAHIQQIPYYQKILQNDIALVVKKDIFNSSHSLKQWLGYYLQEENFVTNSSRKINYFNRWAGRVTGNKVKSITSYPALPTHRGFIGIIAQVSSAWLYKFNKNLTFDKGLFYRNSKDRFELPTMIGKQKLPLGYYPDLETRVLELPLENHRVSMFILLPDDPDHGLHRLEGNLTFNNIRHILATLKDETVNLRLPRFKVNVSSRLDPSLKCLGLTSLFSSKVKTLHHQKENYKGFFRDIEPWLLIDGAFQRIILEVTERGDWRRDGLSGHSPNNPTGMNSSQDQENIGTFGEKYFQVDHPFVYFFWDYITSSVLFIGRVTSPEPIYMENHSSK